MDSHIKNDKNGAEADEADAKAIAPEKVPDSSSTSVSSSHSKFEKGASTPTLKPPAINLFKMNNPFKITQSNSWPIENADQTKPILAPPKFDSTANSGFGRFSSSVGPSPHTTKVPPPLQSVTSASDAQKSTFKLKPPVFGASMVDTSSSYSLKRPASKVEADGGADSSSPAKDVAETPSSGSPESPPDAKRARTTPLEEAQAPIGSGETPTAEGVSSSSEGKNSSSTSSPSPSVREGTSVSTSSQPAAPSVPTFVPLSKSNAEASSTEESSRVNGVGATSPPLSSKLGNAGFIFGQNLQNRVSGVSSSSNSSLFSNGDPSPSSSEGLNLFTAAATSFVPPSSTSDLGGKSLSESSREFSLKEESLKTKYEEVQVVTGEEGEKNVIQMNCKLYGWVNASWQERGRGILRLNDREIRDELHSRLVVRTQGTLTVMLNAKIWAEMSIEKPNDKSVRFTAYDVKGQPKIYLVMGTPKDVTLLHNSLEYRVAAARSQTLDEKDRESDQDPDSDQEPQIAI